MTSKRSLCQVVQPESLARVIPSRLPERHVPLALTALRVGGQMAEGAKGSVT